MGAMLLQAWQCPGRQDLEETRRVLSRGFGGSLARRHLDFGFLVPRAVRDEFLLFKATEFVVVCHTHTDPRPHPGPPAPRHTLLTTPH